jgi:hypothetical protein
MLKAIVAGETDARRLAELGSDVRRGCSGLVGLGGRPQEELQLQNPLPRPQRPRRTKESRGRGKLAGRRLLANRIRALSYQVDIRQAA